MTTLRISEIFGPTIQGEGALIGEPTVFVRAGGCDYRCVWCDSLHAVDSGFRHQWAEMTSEKIWQRIAQLSDNIPLTVTISGGNPALQNFSPLIEIGKAQGYRFAIETQGSVAQSWFADLDLVVFSPKPPSSRESPDWEVFSACLAACAGTKAVLKIVVFDEADYQWARKTAARYRQLPVYLQPGNHTPPAIDGEATAIDMAGVMERLEWLVDRVLADGWFDAHVLPQLHVLIWGNKRGV